MLGKEFIKRRKVKNFYMDQKDECLCILKKEIIFSSGSTIEVCELKLRRFFVICF